MFMKRTLYILTFLCFGSLTVQAQYDLDQLYDDQLKMNRQGMTVLGGWAVSNMVWGGVMATQTEGVNYYFHIGNLSWNSVNLALAGLGYYSARKRPDDASFSGLLKLHENTKQSLLLNAGLDLAYVAGGLWMADVANRFDNPEMFEGFGVSFAMQGLFLFTFDIIFYLAQDAWGKKNLTPILDRIELTGSGIRINLD